MTLTLSWKTLLCASPRNVAIAAAKAVVGIVVGAVDGRGVGCPGTYVGALEGNAVGSVVGDADGAGVGCPGTYVGGLVGTADGNAVGI